MPFPPDPAGRHRAIAGTFTERVRGVTDWHAPAPVEGWSARDVVRHLVEWFPAFLEGGTGIRLASGPSVDDDPVAAWTTHADAVQALLDDPTTADTVLSNPHTGDVPLPRAIDQFYTGDVFMHTWDLARASGQPDRLDAAFATEMLTGMEPMDEVLRASGQYGPRVPVGDDADATDRLMAFVGRDPEWSPGHLIPTASWGRMDGMTDQPQQPDSSEQHQPPQEGREVHGAATIDDEKVVVVTPDGMGVADRAVEGREGKGQQNPADLVEEPAKVMRIGSMIKQLLEEVRNAPLDEKGRARLADVHERSLAELKDGLAPELVEELERISLPFSDESPSDAELRIAQAQLVGWLEGLFHGIQTALVAQQMAAQAQLQQMRALPPGHAPTGPAQGAPMGMPNLPGSGGQGHAQPDSGPAEGTGQYL